MYSNWQMTSLRTPTCPWLLDHTFSHPVQWSHLFSAQQVKSWAFQTGRVIRWIPTIFIFRWEMKLGRILIYKCFILCFNSKENWAKATFKLRASFLFLLNMKHDKISGILWNGNKICSIHHVAPLPTVAKFILAGVMINYLLHGLQTVAPGILCFNFSQTFIRTF